MNILLAIDGSAHADAAARMLFSLGLPTGSRVTVVTVVPRLMDTARLSEVACKEIEAAGQACEDAAARLASEVAKAFAAAGCQTETLVVRGHPADEIVRACAEAELVVLGAKGRAGVEKFLLGDVSQKVVRYARASVLVVRPFEATEATNFVAPEPAALRILLGTDGSEYSAAAVALLSRFRLHPQTQVTVAHVIKRFHPPFSPSIAPGMRGEYERAIREIREEEDAAAKRVVSDACESLAATGAQVDTLLPEGRAAEQLVSLAQARRAHLVVVGSKGRSGIKGFFLGSVSQKVVKYAACSVLVARLARAAPAEQTPGRERTMPY